jgi:thiol:disulfide interchange protein DsbD
MKSAPLLVGLALLASSLQAASTGQSRHVKVALLAENESVRPGQAFRVGLHMRMEEGWHTYWKNPGDAGLPTRLAWTLPDGFAAGPIEWPVPERIPAPPLMSYGYEREVLLPVEIVPPASLPSGEVTLAVKADWLECKEACLPGRALLDIRLAVRDEEPEPGPAAPLFAETRRRLPAPSEGWSLSAEAGPRAVALSFRPPAGTTPSAAYFFPEDAKLSEPAAPQGFEPFGDGHRLTLKPGPGAPVRPDRLVGVLVVEDGGRPRAVQVDVPVAAGDPAPALTAASGPIDGSRAGSLGVALAFAFLGGLVLNLMPCVLPVLSLKVLGFVRQSGAHPDHAWRHGLVYTAGIVVSFWALAAALLVFRAGGERIGWGFQLQSLPFTVVLAGLFLLLSLNLFGVFEVGTSLVGSANLAAGRSGLAASFWNGVLATVVATPCTAPFMGSALGFGLAQPAPVALLVFTALALGMAAPYLLLSLDPRLLRFVPKPGPWMEGFKQLMGFLLMGSVAALVWLFGQQAGVDGIGVLLAALLVTALGAWVYGRESRSARGRLLRTAIALGLMAAGLGIGLSRAYAPPVAKGSGGATVGGLEWQPYSAARVAELRGKGAPVFIDFTAAWCLTCQVNERLALGRAEIVERFRREGIVALRADWTRRDDHITEAIASYGRQGVPVYVLYGRGPGAPPRVLPEVLTPGIVLSAIDEALGGSATAEAAPLAPRAAKEEP